MSKKFSAILDAFQRKREYILSVAFTYIVTFGVTILCTLVELDMLTDGGTNQVDLLFHNCVLDNPIMYTILKGFESLIITTITFAGVQLLSTSVQTFSGASRMVVLTMIVILSVLYLAQTLLVNKILLFVIFLITAIAIVLSLMFGFRIFNPTDENDRRSELHKMEHNDCSISG